MQVHKIWYYITGIGLGWIFIMFLGVKYKDAQLQKTPEGRAILSQRAAEKLADEKASVAEKFENDKKQHTLYLVRNMISLGAKNPASVEFESVEMINDYVCVYYRASNSFGGIVPGVAVFKDGKLSYKVRDYEKHCS